MLALLPLHVVVLVSTATAPPVEVTLFDANHRETHVVHIGRDGSVDAETRAELEHAFRCRRSGKEHAVDHQLLAMIADLAVHYPGKPIEYISAYRGHRGERKTSPHRAGRAFDFRIPGVKLREVRDYAWTKFRDVGVGWYPGEDFVHIDHRPDGEPDLAWTEIRGKNQYHPSWATRIREARPTRERQDRTGT